MTHQQIEEFILSMPETWLDFPFGQSKSVYKAGGQESGEGKIVAIIDNNSHPLRISLRCDPQLAENLRQKYETVLPGENLSKKDWNTIICSGQLSDDEIKDLANLSYQLASQ